MNSRSKSACSKDLSRSLSGIVSSLVMDLRLFVLLWHTSTTQSTICSAKKERLIIFGLLYVDTDNETTTVPISNVADHQESCDRLWSQV
eukprot:m.37547 g.37547  ORF g.37547 m.37547 type:complete len:89 (-) comp9325_c0_seq4:51-317(-)